MSDLIDRQAVIDAMSDTWKHICSVARRRKPTKGEEAVYSDMVGTVNNVPSVNPQEPKYCDRNICISNEYNGISCDECEVIKSQSQESEKINCKATKCENCQNHNYCDYEPQKRSEKE